MNIISQLRNAIEALLPYAVEEREALLEHGKQDPEAYARSISQCEAAIDNASALFNETANIVEALEKPVTVDTGHNAPRYFDFFKPGKDGGNVCMLRMAPTDTGFDVIIPEGVYPTEAALRFIDLVNEFIMKRAPIVCHAHELRTAAVEARRFVRQRQSAGDSWSVQLGDMLDEVLLKTGGNA